MESGTEPTTSVQAAIGFSLGGNVLLNAAPNEGNSEADGKASEVGDEAGAFDADSAWKPENGFFGVTG